MRKIISLIAGSIRTKDTLINQLKEYLDDSFEIKGYATNEDIIPILNDNLVIISSEFVLDEIKDLNLYRDDLELIVAKRTINNDFLDQIVGIPDNTRVLFVNELPEIVYDVIEHIKDLGLTHVDYVPYYPGIEDVDRSIRVAITPGEEEIVPDFITQIYDIGPRIMDFTTITKILNKLGILDTKAGQFSQKYLEKTIQIARRLAESKNRILELNTHLESVIDGLSDGLLVYDKYGIISVSNENLRKILNSNFVFHIGRNLKEILYNPDLLEFLLDENHFEDKVFKVNHTEYSVSKIRLNSSTSTIAKFKSIKETITESDRLKRELIKKGYFAKYEFDDIIGNSERMQKVIRISRKLAKSELTMLIYGENGSGKELFASAIHNASNRKNGPYLAVNFSALSDDLIESELFGYEEGAFTGAKKGGKIGLFEQADGGTIFLDEIGDISVKLQARLLRVLQEKEIMRVGGSEIKPIDVRIVAATNKNLFEMVKNNEFREDLYHRLKMGYIKVPPLRERKSDIPNLISYMLVNATSEIKTISNDVRDKLFQYNWYGNVRELKNTIDYMVAVSDGTELNMDCFPDTEFFQERETLHESVNQVNVIDNLSSEYHFILKKIHYYNNNDIPCGREKLSEDTIGTDFMMTKYQMRTRLKHLMEKDLIIMSKGKKGTVITEKAIGLIMGH
ncbi:MAG: sigma 54-interacting transcriptional regulator [Clostridiales bacterium]|nr:sigma 54-interacting transcriptional regulator [Clostridiales bacterium]